MIETILVPVDGSAHAVAATKFAAGVARACNAKLILLHVMTRRGSGLVPEELRDLARIEHIEVTEEDLLQNVADRIVADARGVAQQAGASTVETKIEHGDPAAMIVDIARHDHVDFIVMGRRGLGSLAGIVLGSVSHKVLQLVDCPCATVK